MEPLVAQVSPAGRFTGPESGPVGLTARKARETNDLVTAVPHFDSTARTIIDGRKFGFRKRIADRKTYRILSKNAFRRVGTTERGTYPQT